MTDKERIEKTYKKIRKKHPDVSSKEDIDTLAIKMDKRNTLLLSLGYFFGTVVCGFLYLLLVGNETFDTTRYLFLVMTGSGIIECLRTLGKYSKIEQRYRPVLKVKYEGQLTRDRILKDGGKVLKKADYIFDIVKMTLYDKEDETDVGIDNETLHEYYVYFKRPDSGLKMTYKVSRDRYMDAVIGAEYLVVVTPSNDIAAVYQATNWLVDSELQTCFDGGASQVCIQTVEQEGAADPMYQPNSVHIEAAPEKTKKLLPILAIVLIVVGYFMPLLVGVPMSIAALVLAIVGLAKQRTKLSVAALVVTVILFLLLAVSVVAMIAGVV